jgi:hypothetical protein
MKKINESYLESFNRQWLSEMPMHTGPNLSPAFDLLNIAIDSNIADPDNKIEALGDSLFRIIPDPGLKYYFIEQNGVRDIIMSVKPFEKGVAVDLVGKRTGAPIYATEFYKKIVQHEKSMLFSGSQMSTDGVSVWLRLLNSGCAIQVYDAAQPLFYRTIESSYEFEQYLKSTKEFERYRYVLSETIARDHSIRAAFELHRAYRLTLFGK